MGGPRLLLLKVISTMVFSCAPSEFTRIAKALLFTTSVLVKKKKKKGKAEILQCSELSRHYSYQSNDQ